MQSVTVDFVSDVTCPWCAIGLTVLERAVESVRGEIEVAVRLQPYELNPDIGPDGEELAAYARRKYMATPEQLAARQAMIRERAAEVGLRFAQRTRVWNTFDAHRLLQWAATGGRQLPLKRALLEAYHVHGENPGAHDVLLRAAAAVGLDVRDARRVLEGDAFAAAVQTAVARWSARGIHAVPTLVIEDRYLVQGAHSAPTVEQILRDIAAPSEVVGAKRASTRSAS